MARDPAVADAPAVREEWVALVERLMADVEKWAEAEGWEVARFVKTHQESGLGQYSAPDLRIRTDSGILDVEVKARRVIGADGRVDLCAFPSLHRMLLIRTEGGWQVKTDAGVEWPRKWGRRTFVDMAKRLIEAP
jgi:hypothetical protein